MADPLTPDAITALIEELRAFTRQLSEYQDTYEHEQMLMSTAADALAALTAQVERLQAHTALVEELRVLVAEVWYAHRDPTDPNYNDCEKPGEACQWCIETRAHLDALGVGQPPSPSEGPTT